MAKMSGNEIRKSFINYFKERGHTVVPSASLVPGGDSTLLFTNAGMVQFKDVFLGKDKRPYKRAVDSQKCMRVAGKHNDLDDVGRDDWHHTFFEMLGNWSFGDYYKKEAIEWAWDLITNVWKIDKDRLWVTVFKDEKGEIPTDSDAAKYWSMQPGLLKERILYFGRKENFWEMAETGPCGPCSEIHIDRGEDACDKKGVKNHHCHVNGDCTRFLELWNIVFIQYNRLNEKELEPLPETHVDTGMGFERIVSVLQGVDSNYKTDLLEGLIKRIQEITGMSDDQVSQNFTPYRVIADHSRTAAFLIADGVIPGNTGRNYVCRMIIRRASRFAEKIGLRTPFLADIAQVVIENYGEAYPELVKNQETIRNLITREEIRFKKTLDEGLTYLDEIMDNLKANKKNTISGEDAFDLYATHGLPLEITKDIAEENQLLVDDKGFHLAMEQHRLASGAGKSFVSMDEDVDIYRDVLENLVTSQKISPDGVVYDPYNKLNTKTRVLALIQNGIQVERANPDHEIEVILPETGFYIESGGQVSDAGSIRAVDGNFEIDITETRKPAAGVIIHVGRVIKGIPWTGADVKAVVDIQRRMDIMRNHTATHLLHAELRKVLGSHARQAGSLVAPDRLRFDFTHPEALTAIQLDEIETGVNKAILENHPLRFQLKTLSEAIADGAMALFGEKYADTVRTIAIGNGETISYELCGGTHVESTGDIGTFFITSEGSIASGIRRIEAITGRAAYQELHQREKILKKASLQLNVPVTDLIEKIKTFQDEIERLRKENQRIKQNLAKDAFEKKIKQPHFIKDIPVVSEIIEEGNNAVLLSMVDLFKNKYKSGIAVVGSPNNDNPIIVAYVSEDLVACGIHAGELVKHIAGFVGGSGGGRPNLAQAGGKNAENLPEAMQSAFDFISKKLH